MEFLLAAITLGFLGSFHCIGMCGPIALAIPVHQYKPIKKHLGIFLYNLGRVFTYTLLGLIFGLLGQSFFIGGFQQVLSVSIGVLLLFSVFLTKTNQSNISGLTLIYPLINKLKNTLSNLFNKKSLGFLFIIGLLNGLLPCGLVYLGIAGAITSGSFLKGALFMFYFGLGTSLIMYAAAFLGQFINLKYRNFIRSSTPYIISVMAILLIVRGLNLGIPYLSPEFEKETKQVTCCEKQPENIKPVGKQIKSCCHKK